MLCTQRICSKGSHFHVSPRHGDLIGGLELTVDCVPVEISGWELLLPQPFKKPAAPRKAADPRSKTSRRKAVAAAKKLARERRQWEKEHPAEVEELVALELYEEVDEAEEAWQLLQEQQQLEDEHEEPHDRVQVDLDGNELLRDGNQISEMAQMRVAQSQPLSVESQRGENAVKNH